MRTRITEPERSSVPVTPFRLGLACGGSGVERGQQEESRRTAVVVGLGATVGGGVWDQPLRGVNTYVRRGGGGVRIVRRTNKRPAASARAVVRQNSVALLSCVDEGETDLARSDPGGPLTESRGGLATAYLSD